MKKVLKKILQHLSAGAARAFILVPGRGYALPAERGFRSDAARLRQDVARIGMDLKNDFKRQDSNGNPARQR